VEGSNASPRRELYPHKRLGAVSRIILPEKLTLRTSQVRECSKVGMHAQLRSKMPQVIMHFALIYTRPSRRFPFPNIAISRLTTFHSPVIPSALVGFGRAGISSALSWLVGQTHLCLCEGVSTDSSDCVARAVDSLGDSLYMGILFFSLSSGMELQILREYSNSLLHRNRVEIEFSRAGRRSEQTRG